VLPGSHGSHRVATSPTQGWIADYVVLRFAASKP
jgi:hypothetical protein